MVLLRLGKLKSFAAADGTGMVLRLGRELLLRELLLRELLLVLLKLEQG